MPSTDKWVNLAEVLRSIEPDLREKLAYCQIHPPDAVTQPVTRAVIAAYISRVELELATIRGGAEGLKDQARNHPMSIQELLEIESWILRRKPVRAKLAPQEEDVIGDWFVSKMGYSYSHTKQRLRDMGSFLSGNGAPNKRPEALRMLDARISNNWSYKELASHMCDCGVPRHTHHCEDRIRKRIKELESFLAKYNIKYSRPAR